VSKKEAQEKPSALLTSFRHRYTLADEVLPDDAPCPEEYHYNQRWQSPGILAYGCTVCDKGFAWELNGLEMLSSVDLEELYPPQKGRPPADVVIQGLGTYRSPP